MTTEEKAIAYDKALERAKDCLKDGTITSTAIDYISTIFPELRESEDDRIRKGIIDFLWKEKIFLQEVHKSVENSPKYRFVMDAIAWLEKQKDTNVLIQEASEKAYTEGMRVERKHWLEKQGESTLIKEVKRRKELLLSEKGKALSISEHLSLGGRIAMLEELLVFANEKQEEQDLANYAKTCKNEQNLAEKEEHPINYKEAEKESLEYRKFREEYGIKDPVMLDEIEVTYYNGATSRQKPAWSKEDEYVVKELGGILYNAYGISDDERETCTNWLKSIEGRVQPQPRQWSDEDEENLQHCCGAIAAADYYTVEDKQEMIDWLTSLKE